MTPRKATKRSAVVERTARVPSRVHFFQRHPTDVPSVLQRGSEDETIISAVPAAQRRSLLSTPDRRRENPNPVSAIAPIPRRDASSRTRASTARAIPRRG